MARPAQMIKKYAAGVDINAADILWALLCALLSSCGTGSFAPLGPAAICAGMLTGMGSRAFLGAVIGSAAHTAGRDLPTVWCLPHFASYGAGP